MQGIALGSDGEVILPSGKLVTNARRASDPATTGIRRALIASGEESHVLSLAA